MAYLHNIKGFLKDKVKFIFVHVSLSLYYAMKIAFYRTVCKISLPETI